MLTALISYGTGSLARRLAGCLAFAASTFFHCILKVFRIQCFNVLHHSSSFPLLLAVQCAKAQPHCPAVRARKAFGFTRSRASPYQLFQNPRGDHAPHAPLSGSVRSGTAHCFRGHYNIGVGVFKVFFFGSGKHAAGHSSGHAQ